MHPLLVFQKMEMVVMEEAANQTNSDGNADGHIEMMETSGASGEGTLPLNRISNNVCPAMSKLQRKHGLSNYIKCWGFFKHTQVMP